MSDKKEVEFKYGSSGKTFGTTKSEYAKMPKDIVASIYRACGNCKLKTKKIDILGGHCSFKGTLEIKNKKCVMKK